MRHALLSAALLTGLALAVPACGGSSDPIATNDANRVVHSRLLDATIL